MGRIRTCARCGVPLRISRDFTWKGNGVIAQTKDPDHRILFYESDNFDALFSGIGELIGVPIEHIVIESKRRSTREYVEHQYPLLLRKVLHRYAPNVLAGNISLMGRCYGLGDIHLQEIRNKGDELDYQTVRIRNPYSLPLFCGDTLGSKEGMAGRDFAVSYQKEGENTYLVKSSVGKHPIELQERLARKPYKYKEGDIGFERCAECGIPLGVARCHWDFDEGTVRDPDTGRRMVMIGPASLEAVLSDLEAELGADVLEATVEAQRRFVLGMLREEETAASRLGWREMAGLRGLGFVREVELDQERMRTVIENSCLDTFMVGTLKGIFEAVSGREGAAHYWERHDDGDLVVEITTA